MLCVRSTLHGLSLRCAERCWCRARPRGGAPWRFGRQLTRTELSCRTIAVCRAKKTRGPVAEAPEEMRQAAMLVRQEEAARNQLQGRSPHTGVVVCRIGQLRRDLERLLAARVPRDQPA